MWLLLFMGSVLVGVVYLKYGGSQGTATPTASASPVPGTVVPQQNDADAHTPSQPPGPPGGPLNGEIVPQQLQQHQQPTYPNQATPSPNYYQQQQPNFEQPNYEPPPPPPPQNYQEQTEPFNPPPFEPGVMDEDFQQNIPPPPPPDEDF